jgi:ABC-type dipeptide/oligopeptide/nickel transport systems, permease components
MATDTSSQTESDRSPIPPVVWRLLSNRRVVIGLVFLVPMFVMAVLGETIAPHDPTNTNVQMRYDSPGGKFLLGTDHLGRDLLSRIIVGARTTLLIGFGSIALALAGGVPIGLAAGYAKGRTDELLMRLMDIVISIPTLLLGLLILAVLSSNVINVTLAIGIVYAPRIARVTRSATLSASEESYVMAAQARGESNTHILFREILPNVTSPIVVEGSVRVGYAIMIGTSLSFLGLGTGPPTPDWGFMIAEARDHIFQTRGFWSGRVWHCF